MSIICQSLLLAIFRRGWAVRAKELKILVGSDFFQTWKLSSWKPYLCPIIHSYSDKLVKKDTITRSVPGDIIVHPKRVRYATGSPLRPTRKRPLVRILAKSLASMITCTGKRAFVSLSSILTPLRWGWLFTRSEYHGLSKVNSSLFSIFVTFTFSEKSPVTERMTTS